MDGYLIRELDGIRRPDIKDYNQVINYQAFEKGLYYEMPERSICVLNNEADLGLLLLTPFPLFHAEARKSLDLFLWDCRYREYVFLDQKNNRSERYYLPFFLPINGSVDRGTGKNRGIVYLTGTWPEDIPAVYVQTGEKLQVLVRLALLESLMRSGLCGVEAIPVRIQEGGAENGGL